VQDEERFALAGTENGFVEVRVLPSGELFGSFRGRLAFMGKSVFGRLRVFSIRVVQPYRSERESPLYVRLFSR